MHPAVHPTEHQTIIYLRDSPSAKAKTETRQSQTGGRSKLEKDIRKFLPEQRYARLLRNITSIAD
jgi:hypothetical protein